MAIFASEHDTAGALATLRTWDWTRWDYDFHEAVPRSRTLSETVNSLAMSGHADPPGALLQLLCDGKLIASGDYQWRASRNGHEYSKAEGGSPIPQAWWRLLKAGLAARDWRAGNTISLPLLNVADASRAELAWEHDRITVAIADGLPWSLDDDDDYAEEYISAYAIEVHCPNAGNDICEAPASQPLAIEHNKGGAPSKYDWERAVAAIVFQWADEGSWHPATKADVKNRFAEWFAARNEHPSETSLKERARWLFEEFQRHSGEADNLAA